MLRRLEDRGEVRGGHFVRGVESSLRILKSSTVCVPRGDRNDRESITLSGADPMNLIGIVAPGEQVPAVPRRSLAYRNGLDPGSDPDAKLSILKK
jgi:ATP-dependent helicase Lhr and Lhr-like helicase